MKSLSYEEKIMSLISDESDSLRYEMDVLKKYPSALVTQENFDEITDIYLYEVDEKGLKKTHSSIKGNGFTKSRVFFVNYFDAIRFYENERGFFK